MASKPKSIELLWAPQSGPQQALVDCGLSEVFLGGARGGGKTDGVLGKWLIKERRYGRHFNAIMLRKTTVSAEDAIERSRELYAPMGARFNEAKLRWRMPNGGRVSFGYLENVSDANAYQGRNVSDCWVEEAGQFDSPAAIDRMFGVLRSAHGVPIQMILTANPGGAGQHWIRQRYQLSPLPRQPKTKRDTTTALQEGRWPRLLNRAVAAEYCGVGIDTFNANVDRGALPRPLQLPTGAVLWDRAELDGAIDLLKTGRRPAEESIGNVREDYEAFKRERHREATKRRS